MSSEMSKVFELGAGCSKARGSFNVSNLNPVAVRLNPDGCLSLDQIAQSFGDNPISEEQAWGIVHQSCVCLKKLFEKCNRTTKLCLVLEFRHLFIHRDGYIHESSFLDKNGKDRVVTISAHKILEKMAILVFSALEQGLQDEYQRQLSPELEKLLDLMLEDVDNVGGTNEVDEGIVMQEIEDETLPYRPVILDDVLKRCESHLASGSETSQHFRNVCRALVTQALELSSFLQKTREICTEELQNLAFSDWANLWQEMMSDLRNGVKLKKTVYTKTPIEFALTPYEMLMEDIRSCRYKLNKVKIDGKWPSRIKKDAHSLLLDFIRSRPPLKPVSERKLPPRETHSTPLELLMASIRSGEGRQNLRKTSGPPEPKNTIVDYTTNQIFQSGVIHDDISREMNRLGSRTVVAAQLDATPRIVQRHRYSDIVQWRRGSPATSGVVHRSKSFFVRRPLSASIILPATSGTKRVIIPDSNFSSFDPDEDSDDDKDSDQEIHPKTPPPYRPQFQKGASILDLKEMNSSQEDFTAGLSIRNEQPSSVPSILSARNLTNLIYDTYSGAPELLSIDPQRSISTFNLANVDNEPVRKDSFPSKSKHPQRSISTFNLFFTNPEPPMATCQKNLASRKYSLSPQPLSVDGILSSLGMRKTSEPVNQINFAKLTDTSLAKSPKTSVTSPPSEFVHIRSTLNRAKFEESQSLDENLRGDILKAKVCFGCKKTRFYFFNRSHKCPWCNYTFCSNCVSKVNVREDFVDAAPLHALTPNRNQEVEEFGSAFDIRTRERLIETARNKSLRESLIEEAQTSSCKTLLRRSNTLGRIDLYGRSDGQDPHRGPFYEQIQLVDVLKDLNVTASDAKTVQVNLCTDCAEVADRHVPEEKLLFDELTRLKDLSRTAKISEI